MGLSLATPPDGYPVTLEEAKAQLNVDHSYDDALIQSMIEAATASLDGPFGDLGRALMPQTWDYYRDDFPANAIRLPLPPLIEVESVNYVDPSTEIETALDPSQYEVDLAGQPYGWVVPVVSGWPTVMETINAVRVRFTAGYQSGESPDVVKVPRPIRQAILLMVRDLYDYRGSFVVGAGVSRIPDAVDRLVQGYRILTI